MVNQSTFNADKDAGDNPEHSTAQIELLQAVLTSEGYPWLADETAQHDDAQIEAAGQALEISNEEAQQGWQKLSVQLAQQFDLAENLANSGTPIVARLQQKFAERLPAEMLARIGEKAQQIVSQREVIARNVLDQMMACVQDVLSHLAEDDLRVIARPMAMAMRGNSADEFIEATIKSVRTADWAALSPIEQARLSLAAARYALSQAENQA
jgi:flagellar basal body rod protein FlgB